MSTSPRSLAGLAALAVVGCLSPAGPSPTGLRLLVHLDRSSYFLDEPVYVVYELTNTGPDTAWVRPFSLETQDLYGTLKTGSTTVPYGGVTGSLTYPPQGYPLPPGASYFEPGLIQDYWGQANPSIGHLYFSRQLPVGSYVFQVDFRWNPSNGSPTLPSDPITFVVRQRDSAEDSLSQTVRLLADLPFDSSTRAQFVPALTLNVANAVSAVSSDPFLAYLCTYQPEVALGSGLGLAAPAVDTIVSAGSVVALSGQTASASTIALLGIYHLRPTLLPSLAPQLGPNTLSGRFATSLVNHGQWWQ